MDFRFQVEIEPKGKKSPQSMPAKRKDGTVEILHGVKNANTRHYEAMLRTLILAQLPPNMPVIETPVMLHFLAVHLRPKAIPKPVRDWHRAQGLPCGPENRLWCPKTPDLDNIRKSIQDALKPRWTDDKLVVAGLALKVYGAEGEPPKLIIRLTDILPPVHYLAAMFGLVDAGEARHPPPRNGQITLFDSPPVG